MSVDNALASGNADSSAEFSRDSIEVTPDQVKALIERITLRGIRLLRWAGDTSPGRVDVVTQVEARFQPPRMRIEKDELSLWFEHRVRCQDEGGEEVATIETGIVMDFAVTGDEVPELSVVSCFADSNGAFIAWPYIREAVQAMSTRLGLAPITLGILRRDDDAYSSD
jgi:hypothetical protein